MKKTLTKFFFVLFAVFLANNSFAQSFVRVGEVHLPSFENGGVGNMVAGVDLDGDGQQEIYAVNNDVSDNGSELIPKLYKYEFNWHTNVWDSVWSATLNIPLQNTWPALTYGDWDKDGKMEIIWGPVNNTSAANPTPPRIVVFEAKGDGSDVMGVPDPINAGNYLPNAQWDLGVASMGNLRPIKMVLTDIDNDNQNELVFATRAGDYSFGVVSVTDIPDNGDGSEIWNLEFSGATGTMYDMAVVDSTAYLIQSNGDVIPVTYENGSYTVQPAVPGAAGGGSWWSACVVDLNKDNSKEIVVASWDAADQHVYLLNVDGASVISTPIADLSGLLGSAGRIYGGSAGDLDDDGNLDFVFGSRDASPNAAIVRVSYNGGQIDQEASYSSAIIDQGFGNGGRWMHIAIANVDADPANEVVYGDGFQDTKQPLVIIDPTGNLPVELATFSAASIGGKVVLNWQTATEKNNGSFEVERKANDGKWSTIGRVQGNGTTTESHNYSYTDEKPVDGINYYRLKQVDFDGTFDYSNEVEVDLTSPKEYSLKQNYPNPFNPSTTINFSIAKETNVTLKIFNLVGEEVATLINNEVRNAGSYDIRFNASNLASGTYIYRLQAGNFVMSKKMILMK